MMEFNQGNYSPFIKTDEVGGSDGDNASTENRKWRIKVQLPPISSANTQGSDDNNNNKPRSFDHFVEPGVSASFQTNHLEFGVRLEPRKSGNELGGRAAV